ncbi:MAG: PxKF domain-containing protein, partial [Candidatus Bathyarchaeia archaeon]
VSEINIDKTPPEVAINIPVDGDKYILNQAVLADWSATDSISGIASTIGTTPNGEAIDTSTVGERVFTVAAEDNAGNHAARTSTYYVHYAYSGVLQPINPDGSSIFKLGSTVPVKFQLLDVNGNYVTTATATIYLAKISGGVVGTEMEATSASAATTGNLFRYDSNDNQYIFNLKTKNLSAGTWQIRISLDDGTSKYVTISLK